MREHDKFYQRARTNDNCTLLPYSSLLRINSQRLCHLPLPPSRTRVLLAYYISLLSILRIRDIPLILEERRMSLRQFYSCRSVE